jgi:hypothetical protein
MGDLINLNLLTHGSRKSCIINKIDSITFFYALPKLLCESNQEKLVP